MLCSNVVLDQCVYFDVSQIRTIDGEDIYPNNYEYSTLRAFLNGYSYYDEESVKKETYVGKGFLNTAFTADQISSIQTTTVDNSAFSTKNSINSYTCNDTSDKIFALSYSDVINVSYGFINDNLRQCQVSDYAKAKGCYWCTSEISTKYLDNGYYLLRSPSNNDGMAPWFVDVDGKISNSNYASDSRGAVRPALNIKVDLNETI